MAESESLPQSTGKTTTSESNAGFSWVKSDNTGTTPRCRPTDKQGTTDSRLKRQRKMRLVGKRTSPE